jgi:hypothetical protein
MFSITYLYSLSSTFSFSLPEFGFFSTFSLFPKNLPALLKKDLSNLVDLVEGLSLSPFERDEFTLSDSG